MATSLRVRSHDLSLASCAALAEAVRRHPSLTSVDVDGAAVRVDELSGVRRTASVALQARGLGPNSALVICACMRGNAALRSLDISCNELGPHGGAALGEALRGNAGLTALRLGENFLGREGGIALALGLENNGALSTLDLTANYLLEISSLAAALPSTRIAELNLTQNRIGDRGCAALCAVLYETRIQHLNLSTNLLGPKSLAALADALRVNARLEALDLSDNKLCGVGFCGEEEAPVMTAAAPATAEALARLCDALRGGGVASLSLADNSLGPHATALLARGLAGNASLSNLTPSPSPDTEPNSNPNPNLNPNPNPNPNPNIDPNPKPQP